MKIKSMLGGLKAGVVNRLKAREAYQKANYKMTQGVPLRIKKKK